MSDRDLILFGTGDMAVIAKDYFTHFSDYRVVAFTVDREYVTQQTFCGLSVIPFDALPFLHNPKNCDMHVCLVYNDMNRLRQKKCKEAKEKGYTLASYISPDVWIPHTAKVGEHAFIFEDNTIQPYATIGDNNVLWSGNHIGHHSRIGNNVFVSSHVVISGHCDIGDNSFIGVNTTLANNTVVGKESWVSHGACISGVIPPNSFVKPPKSDVIPLNEEALARALDRARK